MFWFLFMLLVIIFELSFFLTEGSVPNLAIASFIAGAWVTTLVIEWWVQRDTGQRHD